MKPLYSLRTIVRITVTIAMLLPIGLVDAAPGGRFGPGGEAQEIEPREGEEPAEHDLDRPDHHPSDGAGPIDGERRRPDSDQEPTQPDEDEEGLDEEEP